MVRFSLGNEVRKRRYWEEKEKEMYRWCELEMESWKHIWERYRIWEIEGES